MKKRTDMERLHGEIQELVDELWHLPRFAGGRRSFRPQADCIRSEDPPELRVIVELPGVDPESATARYEQGMLTVTLPIASRPPKTERVAIVIRGRA